MQEANFLYSFALSAFSATATALTILKEGKWNEPYVLELLLIAIVYGLFGTIVSVLLYGRKTQRQSANYESIDQNPLVE